MRTARNWSAVTALTLLCGGALFGQQPQPPKQEGVLAPQTGPTVFRTAVNLVTTDVIVRDGRGQFVDASSSSSWTTCT